MAKAETEAHRELKRLALGWAQANGFLIAACEVRVPKCGYRADVSAYAPRRRDQPARTAVFECKQARADLLKDARDEREARRKVEELAERVKKLEELIGEHRPDLRKGETLFAEFDAWDFSGIEHVTHRRVLEQLGTWQGRVLRGTKFAKLFRWRAADYFYLVAEEGIFAEAEIPAGWGLLVRRRGREELELARKPVWAETKTEVRAAMLESIAMVATRAVNREMGVALVPPPWAREPEA